ncbi:MAG: hypothetical protein GY928_06500 [Colwellia sp.]|nr:hypothetical protein [Colwellia sp.]
MEHFNNSDLVLSRVLASHYGRGNARELSVEVVKGVYTYTVTNKGAEIYKGADSVEAVNTYNDLEVRKRR